MTTILNESVISHMEPSDRPALGKAPPQPVSVEQALKDAQPKPFDASNVPPLCALDIIMLNGRLDTVNEQTGEAITYNPEGRFTGRLKDHDLALAGNLNDDEKTFMLDNLIKVLMQSETSWDSLTAWSYAKGKLSARLDYKTVTSYAEKKFADLAELGQIKILNKFNEPITYGKF